MKFKSFPNLSSDRLFLRKIEISDAEEILFLRSDQEVTKFIERPEERKTRNINDASNFIKDLNVNFKINKSFSWGITISGNTKIIGTICLWNFSQNNKTAEVGFDLDPKFQRKGIMNESLKMIVDFGFKVLMLDKIEAFTHRENLSSKKLLVKNGFQLIEDHHDLDNKFNVIFELDKASN